MSPRIYSKPPQTLDQQAQLLISRGLKDVSKDELVEVLSRISYYRLRGYTYLYQDNTSSNSEFLPTANWSSIKNDYLFDSALRNLIVEALGFIEIAVRCQMEYQLSICIITTLLDVCAPNYDFRGKLKQVMKMVRPEQLPSLGFPENWEEQDLFA